MSKKTITDTITIEGKEIPVKIIFDDEGFLNLYVNKSQVARVKINIVYGKGTSIYLLD